MPTAILDPLQEILALKAGLRDALIQGGHPFVFQALGQLLDWRVFLGLVLPILVIERWRPARPGERGVWPGLAFDWIYPGVQILCQALGLAWIIFHLKAFYLGLAGGQERLILDRWPLAFQFITVFLVQDLMRYLAHLALHKVPWAWHVHAIHHSQTRLNPATNFRNHPFEALLSATLTTLPIGFLGGEPVAWIYSGWTSLLWDLLIHSNLRWDFGPLGRILVSPQYHRIHHSRLPEHRDRNFGNRLVLWDWLFGTASSDRSSYPPTGVDGLDHLVEQDLRPRELARAYYQQLMHPFRCALEGLTSRSMRIGPQAPR
jgi:sterol desaturase/sphingolipid hydroxylase (fatty acid hydroxylase superfamily)